MHIYNIEYSSYRSTGESWNARIDAKQKQLKIKGRSKGSTEHSYWFYGYHESS